MTPDISTVDHLIQIVSEDNLCKWLKQADEMKNRDEITLEQILSLFGISADEYIARKKQKFQPDYFRMIDRSRS